MQPTTRPKSERSIFSYTYLFLGFIALFLYVGVEVMAGDIIQIYGKAINIPLDIAKHFTTYTMIAMLASYLLGIALIPKYISQEKCLRIAGVLWSYLFTWRHFYNGLYIHCVYCVAWFCQCTYLACTMATGNSWFGQTCKNRFCIINCRYSRRRYSSKSLGHTW